MMNTEERKILYDRQYYYEHREEKLEYRKQYYRKHAEKYKEQNKQRYQENRELHLKQAKERALKLRMEVLHHYGGDPPKCSCCDEPHIEFLAIDHINGNGTQHRRKIGVAGGQSFYCWLRKNNYPEGFRVLCHNCNSSLGFYGYCPHEKEVQL